MRMDKGKPFRHVEADGEDAPTFSQMFLYERVGKDEARFILGVAEEYEHVIEALGPAAVIALLDVKPRLVRRLGTGEKLEEWLEDARSDESRRRYERMPPEVTLDSEAAHEVWQMLHAEYRQHFDPEKSLPRDTLRTYHVLTDALGEWEQDERRKEQERLPEKLEKQKARKAEIAKRKQERTDVKKKIVDAMRAELRAAIDASRRGEHRSVPLTVAELVGEDDESVKRLARVAAEVEWAIRPE